MSTEKKLSFKEILVAGMAMFAIFFGAGNLILPPKMGQEAGMAWPLAFIGFVISDIVLILCGIQAMSRRQGSILAFGKKVSPHFGAIIGTLVVLCIGPLIAIPRTAATTYEVAIEPFLPNVSSGFFSVFFFVLVLVFTINGSKVVDIVGKYMTPILLVILLLIIAIGVSKPMPAPTVRSNSPLAEGFTVGYMAMDALGALLFAGIILNSFRDKGITSEEQLSLATNKAGIFAGIGLAIVYGGLTILGAYSQSYTPMDISRSELLNAIVFKTLGKLGIIAIAIAVSCACLTTAVGLASATGNFFQEISRGKFKYEVVVVISLIISALLAVLGVEKIVATSTPLLLVIYPLVVAMMIVNMIDKGDLSPITHRCAVLFTFPAAVFDCLIAMEKGEGALLSAYARLPFASQGFGWILFAGLGILIGLALGYRHKKRTKTEEKA